VRLALRFLVGYGLVSAIIVPVALISLWPHIPKTTVGWLLLLVLAPPVYILLESLGSLLLSDSLVARWFGDKGGFSSVARIGYGVAVMALFLGLIFIAGSRAPDSFREFLANQFR
jgi:hypothetical protein